MQYPKVNHECKNWRKCKETALNVGVSDNDDRDICKNCEEFGAIE